MGGEQGENTMSNIDNDQEPSKDLEATPAQDANDQGTNNSGTLEGKPKEGTPSEEAWEYKGDRKDAPEEFQKYVKGLDRYVSKKDQALVDANKKSKAYDEFVKSDDFKAYQKFLDSKGQVEPSPGATQEELDAIALGDPNALQNVIDRRIKSMAPDQKNIQDQMAAVTKKQRELDTAEHIREFATLHPDFMGLIESPLGEHMVSAARNGVSLDQIYKNAKDIESYVSDKTDSVKKANIKAKKAGSTVKNSISGSSDVVYAEDDNDARRLAIELSRTGDPRQVRIKKK